jgi:hypothetical protein
MKFFDGSKTVKVSPQQSLREPGLRHASPGSPWDLSDVGDGVEAQSICVEYFAGKGEEGWAGVVRAFSSHTFPLKAARL